MNGWFLTEKLEGDVAESGSTEGYRFPTETRSDSERRFAQALEAFIAGSHFSRVEMMSNFPLYTPRQTIANFLIRYEIFKRVLNVHGSVVECGVLFGGGLMSFAQFSAILEPTNHQRRIVGFDTFEGFPPLSEKDHGSESVSAKEGGLAVDSREELLHGIELFDANRFIGHIPKVELIKGDATQTIPKYLQENPHLIVSLLYLDFDIYEPTRVALEQLMPRIPRGGVVAFDELNLRAWPGETRAVLDTVGVNSLRLERFTFGSTISFAQIE
jgi:hypothetical protein